MKRTRVLSLFSGLVVASSLFSAHNADAATVVTMDESTLLNSHMTGYCVDTPSAPYAADNQPVIVNMNSQVFTIGKIDPTWWKTTPTPDPAWQLSFRSLYWAQPLA